MCIYQDHYGWDWGFGIYTVAIVLGTIIFAFGLPLYRIHVARTKNGIIEIIQVYVAAIRTRNLPLPEDPIELYEIEQDKEATVEIEYQPQIFSGLIPLVSKISQICVLLDDSLSTKPDAWLE